MAYKGDKEDNLIKTCTMQLLAIGSDSKQFHYVLVDDKRTKGAKKCTTCTNATTTPSMY